MARLLAKRLESELVNELGRQLLRSSLPRAELAAPYFSGTGGVLF